MMAKPMKTLELHYPVIQFLIIIVISRVTLDLVLYILVEWALHTAGAPGI